MLGPTKKIGLRGVGGKKRTPDKMTPRGKTIEHVKNEKKMKRYSSKGNFGNRLFWNRIHQASNMLSESKGLKCAVYIQLNPFQFY